MTTQPLNDRPHGPATCPECGLQVEPGGRGLGRIFCSKAHRLTFNARTKARGAVLAPYEQAAAQTRHAKPGTLEAEVSRFARSEITSISSIFNDEDEAAGRPPAWRYVESLMRSGTRYMDRRMKG